MKLETGNGRLGLVIVGMLLSLVACPTFAQELAVQLAEEGDHDGAAIEFRRLALASDDAESRGHYYWAAAFEYLQDEEHQRVADVLDRAEDASPEIASEAMLLRGESALQERRWDEAGFYLESASRTEDEEARAFSTRRLASVRMWEQNAEGSRELIEQLPGDHSEALVAVDEYLAGKDKNPKWGGVLGLVPGLGYLYAGEPGNAFRSLLLNSIFIFGMIETSEDEEWGAFTAITFFEITWYTGSIYGGIDASYRYNQERVEDVVQAINGHSGFQPDYQRLPNLSLKFEF